MMPSNDRALALAEGYLSRGAASQALELVKLFLARNPEHARAHALLARALIHQRRWHAAQHEASLALSLAPEDAYCHSVMAAAFVTRRNLGAARDHVEQAIALEPDNASLLVQRAHIELVDGRIARALASAHEALSLDPDDPDVLCCCADTELAAGNLAAAREAAERALRAVPEHTDSLVAMGNVLLLSGDVAGAREHALWALNSAPDNDGALRLLVAVKTRQSWGLGLWWRANAWLARSPGRAILVLVGAFLVQRALTIRAIYENQPMTKEIVSFAWLGLCIYSWVAPALFQRALKRELKEVRLRSDF
jgi:tetratricopeptide (TPR) repeat protein